MTPNIAVSDQSSSDSVQTDGESLDSSDKPPPQTLTVPQSNGTSPSPSSLPVTAADGRSAPMTNDDSSLSMNLVPLPPPESGTYEKEPGYTRCSLQKLVLSTSNPSSGPDPSHNLGPGTPSPGGPGPALHPRQKGSTSTNSTASSPPSSPSDGSHSEAGWSPPSTRPPSQAPSRAPSFSAGTAGGKVFVTHPTSKSGSGGTTINPPPPPPGAGKGVVSPPASPVIPTFDHQTTTTLAPAKANGKPPSVNSDGGGHKFTLKDLLASGPKVGRRSSVRSTGSSKKSDSDGGGARSSGGDSVVSLTQKYGVCQKVAIGKGATSVVRLAHKWDRTEEKLYAVKEFRKRRKNETEKEYVKKLTAEFCISSTLHHVNIVETVDLIQDENQHWCEVMEFCPGGDLYAAIKKGGMSPSEVECCFKQILNGVAYLHSQGVAHRDIKPENLFFDTKGHLKIGDYGASTVYRLPWETTVHMSTGLCGSEPYIAPEQFLGKPYDARLVDIWACAVVYYCLHFQELPWRVAQVTDPLYQAYSNACASPQPAHSSCPPTIHNLSPRACRGLIRRMLEPNPKTRATIEEVVKHPWVQSIQVCHAVEKPLHVHVHARAMTQTQA